jgi:hypothetical protein
MSGPIHPAGLKRILGKWATLRRGRLRNVIYRIMYSLCINFMVACLGPVWRVLADFIKCTGLYCLE